MTLHKRSFSYVAACAHDALSERWIAQLRWQRLPAFENLALMLGDHLDGVLNHCRVKVRFGVVEAINGNINPF